MKNYDEIMGALPYRESPEYLDRLIDRCKENARVSTVQTRPTLIRPWMYGLAAAIVAAVLTLGITLSVRKSPMDRFLAGLTDEEAELIVSYSAGTIPEMDNNNND